MSEADVRAALARYVTVFESLRPDNLDTLGSVMTEDIHFADPFNDLRGRDQVTKIFAEMFATLANPRFTILAAAPASGQGEIYGLIRWRLLAQWRGRPYQIDGMSEVRFAADGRVRDHIDHWDAARQFYERLPLIGTLLRMIRRRLAV